MAAVRPADAAWPAPTRRLVLVVAAGLCLVAAVRLVPVAGVFRDDWVVLLSNDPYFYRYWVERVVGGGLAPWAFPPTVATGEPLLVAVLSAATWLLGGRAASGVVLALYPVLSAVVVGVLVYATAERLARDSRVGLAALALFAVTPANAYRTSVGGADHHAFDYVWLALTTFALVALLVRTDRDRRTWGLAGLLAVAVAGQALAWEAAPLLLVPLAPAVALVALVEVRRDGPTRLVPVAAGLLGAAVLVGFAHLVFGWQAPAVVGSVALLGVGSAAVVAATRLVARADRSRPALALLGVECALALLAVAALVVGPLPLRDLVDAALRGTTFLTRQSDIGEMSSLGSSFGTVAGPLLILGFAPFLALPVVPWALRRAWRERDPAWIPPVLSACWLAGLTVLQRRFGGELAPVMAILAGLSLVALLAWLDLVARPPVLSTPDPTPARDARPPSRDRLALLGGLVGVLVGTGAFYTSLIDRLLVIDDDSVAAARFMRRYAADRGWSYPRNYVLSKWGRNRMYNYFVNGQSSSYAFAERNYEDFLFSNDGPGWYDRLQGRVGFVVTRDLPHLGVISRATLQSRLHERLGSAGEGVDGLAHYRAVFVSHDGSRKVFTLVPGATLRGPAGDADEVVLSTRVAVDGATFTYRRRAPVADGRFEVRVAHPGEYVRERDGAVVASVEESAVTGGDAVAASLDGEATTGEAAVDAT